MFAPKGFNYLFLPRELRNQIMKYALNPGEVCIPTNNSSLQDRPRYGVQVLATCRQAYEEGYTIWYGKNQFRIRSCAASEMRRILGAYRAKHLRIMPSLIVECTLYDLPRSHLDFLLGTMLATADHEMIASANFDRSYAYARNKFWDDFTAQLEQEWRTKIYWLHSRIPGGHRMHVSLDRSIFDRVWFSLKETGMEFGFGLLCDAIEVKTGSTIATEIELSQVFTDDLNSESLPEGYSGLALTQGNEECPRNRTLRNYVRICGLSTMRFMYDKTGTF